MVVVETGAMTGSRFAFYSNRFPWAVKPALPLLPSPVSEMVIRVEQPPTVHSSMKRFLLILLFIPALFLAPAALAQNPGLANYRNTGQTNAPITIKASQGGVYGFTFINTNTSPVYVKFFNKGTGTVVGTDAPFAVIAVPPGNSTSPGMVYLASGNVPWEFFLSAITVAATTGIADSSNTSPAVGLYTEVLFK